MRDWLTALDHRADLRGVAGLTRTLRPREAGDGVVDLAGNDYLGLATHPDVVAAATAALAEFGLGATGSRLVRGSTVRHAELERALAGWIGTERALVYSSGYLANLGAVRALVQGKVTLVTDAHNHASLIDGCRLTGAPVTTYDHASVAAAEAALAALRGKPAVVVTESVFSVDGDLAPLRDLHTVARRHGALLLVDDAHALGVLGPDGAGAVAAAGLAGERDVVVTATLSKALGGAGGVIAGPRPLMRHLIDTSRPFIFDTALPPAVAAGVTAALAVARDDDGRRAVVRDRAALLSRRLGAAGLTVTTPAAGIVSVTAPGPDEAVAWQQACRDLGVAVGCFRPPSTPDRSSRLRLTVNAGLADAHFAFGLDAVVECAP